MEPDNGRLEDKPARKDAAFYCCSCDGCGRPLLEGASSPTCRILVVRGKPSGAQWRAPDMGTRRTLMEPDLTSNGRLFHPRIAMDGSFLAPQIDLEMLS
jgi:hypothetical protein